MIEKLDATMPKEDTLLEDYSLSECLREIKEKINEIIEVVNRLDKLEQVYSPLYRGYK